METKNIKNIKAITMKAIKLLAVLILSIFMFSGCNSEYIDLEDDDNFLVSNISYTRNAKLKNISYTESVNSKKGGIIITQYEYDKQGRISKESRPMYENGTPMFEAGTIVGLFSYSDYIYNNSGQLEKMIYYHSNLYAGFLNLQTHIYSYDTNGNKIKEVIEYPQITQDRTDYTIYHYENNRLVREDIYNGGVFNKGLITYIVYEYDNHGKLVKETNYSAEDNTPGRIAKHSYENGLNIKTEIFNSYMNNERVGEIRRYYDKNENLIYLESKELAPYSSAMSYVTIYDYY